MQKDVDGERCKWSGMSGAVRYCSRDGGILSLAAKCGE